MLNTLLYILHSTEHLILFKKSPDQKLCLITQSGLLYKITLCSEPLLLYALFCKYVNVTAALAHFTLNLNDLVGHRHYCNE